jgi:predicted RNA-binding protein (virulence factor B family)
MTASTTLGTRHSLEVIKPIHNGLLLDGGSLGEVLLPSREVEGQNLGPGDSVLVTLYSDGQGRPMASLRTPRAQPGGVPESGVHQQGGRLCGLGHAQGPAVALR